jgi:hypothetical protein
MVLYLNYKGSDKFEVKLRNLVNIFKINNLKNFLALNQPE